MDLGAANNQSSFFYKKETKGFFGGWGIIIGFTLVFSVTYTLHMYVAEIYIHDHFAFLLVKYCVGFVFVILVPVITLCLEKEIRYGITSVFGSAVLCLQDISETDNEDQIQVAITEPWNLASHQLVYFSRRKEREQSQNLFFWGWRSSADLLLKHHHSWDKISDVGKIDDLQGKLCNIFVKIKSFIELASSMHWCLFVLLRVVVCSQV